MFASWSKLPGKIDHGNTFDLGNFDQCLQIRKNMNQEEITGQHCLFQFYSTSNESNPKGLASSSLNNGWKHLNERFGGSICLPATCKPETVKIMLQFMLDGTSFKLANDYKQADYCKTLHHSKYSLSNSTIMAFCITSFLLICVILSTVYDISTKNARKTKRRELFLAFSAYTNGSNIFESDEEVTNEVKSIHFFRSIAAISILFSNIVYFTFFFPLNYGHDFEQKAFGVIAKYFAFNINAFFVFSGFLTTRSIIKNLNE